MHGSIVELLRLVLRLEHGIPSHDTFSRVFRLLEPKSFERMFSRFMAAFAKANGIKLSGVVAVDGKAVRGAYERGGKASPLQLVNVFAVDARRLWPSGRRPGATRQLALWRCWVFSTSKTARLRPMHCTVRAH